MNKFYKVIAEMKADEKYISALKKRAKTKNPKRALAKTKKNITKRSEWNYFSLWTKWEY